MHIDRNIEPFSEIPGLNPTPALRPLALALLALGLFGLVSAPITLAQSSAVAASAAAATVAADANDTNNDSGEDAEGQLLVSEEVFVEGDLPAIPTSNTVAAKLPLALSETPASVGVVDRQLIDEQGSFLLGDALRNLAGVNVHPGSGTFDFFVLRGLDSLSSGLILTDGAPEPETTSYQLYNVERVEVLKGPASFLYGGGPLGGTVNLVRKQPLSTDFTRLGLSFGSFSTSEATIDTNHRFETGFGEVDFRFNGVWQESDLYRDDKDSSTLALNPSFAFRVGDDTSVVVNLEFAEIEYKNDQGLPILFDGSIPNVPRTRSYQSPFDDSDQEALRLQVDVEHRISDRVTLRNKTYYRQLDWLSTSTTFNGVFPNPFTGDLLVSRNLVRLDDVQDFYGNQLELLFQVETGGVTHNLLAGIELARQTDAFDFSFGFLPLIDLVNPIESATDPFLFPAFGVDTTNDVVAPYLVDQITFNDRFQLLLGARYDRIDFEDSVAGVERDDDQVSPMLGVVLSPTDTVSLYASYGEAFAPQSTFAVAQTGRSTDPEESNQFEIGLKKQLFGGDGQLTLAFYQADRENVAIPDQTGILAQTGDQSAEGFELELQGKIRDGLRAFFSYAYTDSELTEFREIVVFGPGPLDFFVADRSGNVPAYTPEHLASFWLSQEVGSKWTVAGGARFVGEQFIDEDNVVELEDYVVLDAAIAYDSGPWRLSLNLRNLGDEEYFTRASSGNSVIPVAGFNATTGIQYRF